MSLETSPLRDRALFVVGAPRSGTTWLARLLSAHPAIASVGNESHLFDRGVNTLFDNHEQTGDWERFLTGYLERAELVDLVRDLCDGVFLRMRERAKPGATHVLEKTPVVTTDPRAEIRRKLEVYPDGWFVHIVRDGRAVARSLTKMPWARDWLPGAGAHAWARWVSTLREELAGRPRALELRYEDLRADPPGRIASILEWAGLDAPAGLLEEVAQLSTVPYASRDADPAAGRERWSEELSEADLRWIEAAAGPLLRELGYAGGPLATAEAGAPVVSPEVAADPDRVARAFIAAFRDREAAAMAGLAAPDVLVRVRTGSGDLEARGPEALAALQRVAVRVFAGPFRDTTWAVAPGPPIWSGLFAGERADGARVDLMLIMQVAEGRVVAAGLLTVGDPGGRAVRPLEL